MRRLNSVLLLFLFLIVTLTCAPAPAQTVDTAIEGTVTDSSGAVLPGATVTVTSSATGIKKQAVTASTGDYSVTYLIPGTYDVTVSANGFGSDEQKGIVLQINQRAKVNVVHEGRRRTADGRGAGHPAPAPDRGRLPWRRHRDGQRSKPSAQRP